MYYGECSNKQCRKVGAIDANFCAYCGEPILEKCPICGEEEPAEFIHSKICKKSEIKERDSLVKDEEGILGGKYAVFFTFLIIALGGYASYVAVDLIYVLMAYVFVMIMKMAEGKWKERAMRTYRASCPKEAKLLEKY